MKRAFTRRQFHKLAGFLSACAGFGFAGKIARAATPDLTSRLLDELVTEYAKAPDNPWLMIHGIRATGKDFALGEQKAVDYLCSHCLKRESIGGVTYLYMPIDRERHPHCFLSEAILDSDVPLDYIFKHGGQTYSVADLVSSARALFEFDPGNEVSVDADTLVADTLAWSLIVFAHTTDPGADGWINAHGREFRFSTVVESAMAVLERGTRQLQIAMINPRPQPVSDRVHEFVCAGTHLVYGLTQCLKLGHKRNELPERMKRQFDVLSWRLENDPKLIDAYYDELHADYPLDVVRMYRLDTKLKFFGHAFETINYIRLHNLFEPTAEQEAVISKARQDLAQVVYEIAKMGIGKYKDDGVLFDLLVGDSCHAYHAIRLERAA